MVLSADLYIVRISGVSEISADDVLDHVLMELTLLEEPVVFNKLILLEYYSLLLKKYM